MAKIDNTGYILETQNKWFSDEEARYITIDPSWNLDPSTPDGIKLATDSEIWANLDELGQKAFNSKDPNKAIQNDLEVLASITGTVRSLGTFSTAEVDINGIDGTLILAGSLIESTSDGTQWATDIDVTIIGVAIVNVTAVKIGNTQASAGVLTKIVNPQNGWVSVNNFAPALPGTNPDTDAELRIKRNNGVSLPGTNQIDSTYAAVANLTGVGRVAVYENDTGAIDGNGMSANSVAVIVDGGIDADIGMAIYIKKSPGTKQEPLSNPFVTSVVSPVTGNSKDIIFNRPAYVDVVIVYNVVDDGTLPTNIIQLIKDATLSYVAGELLNADCGFNQSGFGIGEDVQSGRFYTPVNHILGQYGDSYVTSITVDAGATVVIGFENLSRFTDANISVSIL